MPAAMKVLQLATGELFGGAERQIIALSRGLLASGVDVLAVVMFERELAAQLRAAGVRVEVLRARGTFDLTLPGKLRALIGREAPDVIHVHNYRPHAMLALAGAAVAGKVVKTEHGLPEMATSVFENLRAHTYRALENLASRRLGARMVYVTQELRARCALAHTGLAQAVVYNGVDLERLVIGPRPPEYRPDTFNLIAIGRLEHVKGFDLAIQAVAAMPAETPVHLYVLGAGPEQPRLEALASKTGGRVTLLGFRRDPFAWLANADAMLMPSRHEGLPFVLLEAWALRTPVIASAVGGLKEVIRDGETGLLVPGGDVAALAQAVSRIAGDPELRERMRDAAHADVNDRFDARAMAAGYLEQYEALTKT